MKKYLVAVVLVAAAGGWFWFSQLVKNYQPAEMSISQPDVLEESDNQSKPIDKVVEPATKPETPANKPTVENSDNSVQKAIEPEISPEPKIEHAITVLPVPFTSQAPKFNWDLPYQEACEEASMIMVAEYFKGNRVSKLEPDYADKEILKLVAWQQLERGFYEDITAKEVVSILQDYFKLSARVEDYKPDKIKDYIKQGQLVLLPAAGRLLDNPNFRRPGPLYHMLVVKGFTEDEFITNDPGTRNGFNYRYDPDILAKAVHDWNGGEVLEGEQVMVVVGN